MSNKPSASKLDTVIKLILIFFITLLSFSVGTFVGKQVSDSEYKKAAIEGEYDSFSAKTDGSSTEEDALSEEDIASLTEEFVEKEKRKLASDDAKNSQASKKSKSEKDYKKYVKSDRPKTKPKKKKTAKNKAVPKPAKRVAANQAPTKNKPEKRKPTSILPNVASSAIGKFTVQVASYADEKEARVHSANLKEKGWNAFYVPAKVRGRTWFRVSVGLFSTSGSAEKFKRELVKDNTVNSAYVQKIVK